MSRRSIALTAALLAVLATVGLFAILPSHWSLYRLRLKTMAEDAADLRPGAEVRVAGVDVGRVTAVRARPDLKAAEVDMILATSYPLQIPDDARAKIVTDGVLGPALVDIDVKNASGPPAADGTMLQFESSPTFRDYLNALAAVGKGNCDSSPSPDASTGKKTPGTTSQPHGGTKPLK